MAGSRLGKSSLKELQGVNADLVEVVMRAVDLSPQLVPYINGKLRWEWAPIYLIADAMRTAARELDVAIHWGGAWDVDFIASNESPEDMVASYIARRREAGKRAFVDGPHFELAKPAL